MPIYNPNDFYPRTGQEVKSDGTTVNEGDGINADGSQNVRNTANAPTLLATIPFSQLTANTTKYTTLLSVLARNVKGRTFIVTNTTDQPLTSTVIFLYDSTTDNPSTKSMSTSLTNPVANGVTVDTSENKPLLLAHVDSIMIGTGIGATAPTTGNVKIYVTEMI